MNQQQDFQVIPQYFDKWVHTKPGTLYLVDHSLERDEIIWTYETFAERVTAATSALYHAGIRAHDVVAVQLPNNWEFVALTVATWQLGAVICPIMPIFREHEVRQILQKTHAKLLVVPKSFRHLTFTEMAQHLADEFPHLTIWMRDGQDFPALEQVLDQHKNAKDVPLSLPAIDDLAEIVFTSGTTGRPKGVMHSHRTLLTGLLLQKDFLHLGDGDVIFMPSPFAHQTGFLYGVLFPLLLGIPAVYQDIWDPDVALSLLSRWRVTFSMGATPFLSDLTSRYHPGQHDLSALKIFISAGAPIPRILVEKAHTQLGVHVLAGWGMSENSLVTLVRPEDELEKTYTTDGRPVPHMSCRIVDEAGEIVPPGTEGELEVKGPQNFLGYFDDPETTQNLFKPGGWLRTGDLAIMDDEGYIRITGRARDMINRGGEKIPIADVEELLYRHPAIKEAALVGVPDPRLGQRACAVVVLQPGAHLSLAELTSYLDRCRLTKQFWPERLEIIDEMPKTPSGKIQKFRLREWIHDGAPKEMPHRYD
ncbi:AMP-binding protein [Sulfobacillus thermosulfidooxidans]|uniref:AMP-binding protein n=1 Tax=Sulfobacillus thermosulfidooxidans TaxID=28034 RepID=UPI0006B67A44|nr:AMP-binding protein [Sulfobacillus thermosulfidooxidans]